MKKVKNINSRKEWIPKTLVEYAEQYSIRQP